MIPLVMPKPRDYGNANLEARLRQEARRDEEEERTRADGSLLREEEKMDRHGHKSVIILLLQPNLRLVL